MKLTTAQRRVLLRMARSDEMIATGHAWGLPRQYRHDRRIEGKLIRKGCAVYEMRTRGYGYMWRVWLTAKGYAMLDGAT
jgi:hypothetical protein